MAVLHSFVAVARLGAEREGQGSGVLRGASRVARTVSRGGGCWAARCRDKTFYERPSRKSLDTHRYPIEVAGHASDGGLMRVLDRRRNIRVVGSCPRAY